MRRLLEWESKTKNVFSVTPGFTLTLKSDEFDSCLINYVHNNDKFFVVVFVSWTTYGHPVPDISRTGEFKQRTVIRTGHSYLLGHGSSVVGELQFSSVERYISQIIYYIYLCTGMKESMTTRFDVACGSYSYGRGHTSSNWFIQLFLVFILLLRLENEAYSGFFPRGFLRSLAGIDRNVISIMSDWTSYCCGTNNLNVTS